MKQTSLKIEGDNFELTTTNAILNYTPPQGGIGLTTGKIKWKNNSLELYQYEKTISRLIYGKPNNNNPDYLDSDKIDSHNNLEEPVLRGVRKDAIVVIDTVKGQVKYLDNSEPIILDIIKQSNSTYFVNKDYCFMKPDDNISKYVNKCNEIQKSYN